MTEQQIPHGWKREKLGGFLKLSSGKKKPDDLVNEPDEQHCFPVYGGNGVMGYSGSFNMPHPCLSVGRVGEYCGSVYAVRDKAWITDNSLFTKDISNDCNFDFLYYLLVFLKLSKLRNKGSQPLISQKPIYALQTLLPPPEEQEKIGHILSTWDEAIETKKQLLENSQLRKKALMQKLLTCKERLPGFTGKWEIVRLSEISKPQQWSTIPTSSFTREGYPVYGATGFLGYYSAYNHDRETVAVVCRGASCGKVMLIGGKSYITGNSMCLDDLDSKKCTVSFLYYVLHMSGFGRIISGSAQPQIIIKDMQKFQVVLPPIEEQRAIASVLIKADEENADVQNDLFDLKQEKEALMQQLLTGKKTTIRVQELNKSANRLAHTTRIQASI